MLIAKSIKQENHFCHPRSSEDVPTTVGQNVDKEILRTNFEHDIVDLFTPLTDRKDCLAF